MLLGSHAARRLTLAAEPLAGGPGAGGADWLWDPGGDCRDGAWNMGGVDQPASREGRGRGGEFEEETAGSNAEVPQRGRSQRVEPEGGAVILVKS